MKTRTAIFFAGILTAATSLPLSADQDTGYQMNGGDGPHSHSQMDFIAGQARHHDDMMHDDYEMSAGDRSQTRQPWGSAPTGYQSLDSMEPDYEMTVEESSNAWQ